MAKVLGESGRYVTKEAAHQSQRILLRMAWGISALAILEGFIIASFIPFGWLTGWPRAWVALGVIPCAWMFCRSELKKADALFRKREDMRRGAHGETLVGRVLADFPDDFFVINDLTTPFGNLDHVVVGPTGVFVLDSKSWRGVVSADGKGELLVNGRRTDKTHVRNFVGRMLGVKDRVRLLAPGLDPFYQGLFVFTAARVDAKWGSTGNVHCVREDQLYEYIVEKNFGTRLQRSDIRTIAQAFLGLAQMDREFGRHEQTMANRSSSATTHSCSILPKAGSSRAT